MNRNFEGCSAILDAHTHMSTSANVLDIWTHQQYQKLLQVLEHSANFRPE